MENQRLVQFDSLLYTIYGSHPLRKMKQDALRILYHFIPCTFCSILSYTNDEDVIDAYHDDPVCYPEAYTVVEEAYIRLEGTEKNRWVSWEPECKVYRTSDLYQDTQAREQSQVYRMCFLPYNLYYAVYATLRHQNKGLGCLTLYRSKAAGDFTNEELFILQMIARHLSQRLALELGAKDAETFTAETGTPDKNNRLLDLALRYHLTAREMEVLENLTLHQSMEELAQQLHISENTLKKHLQSLYRKTKVNRFIQLYSLKTDSD